jgi:hypothetical protein
MSSISSPNARTSIHLAGGEATSSANWRIATLLFASHLAIYLLNCDFLPDNDATFSTYLPALLSTKGTFSVTPSELPSLFLWRMRTPRGVRVVHFRNWEDKLGDSTASRLRAEGMLTAMTQLYCLTKSIRINQIISEDEYVNTFGPTPGLLAFPFFAALNPGGPDPFRRPRALWCAAKLAASVFVALSVMFVYLACGQLTSHRMAVLIACAYGLGTCVWSLSAQALWQHGPNELFLAMGTYFLLKVHRGRSHVALCGLSYAIAVACRPTSAIVVLAVGAEVLLADRKTFLAFCLGGLPIAAALGCYNSYYHGSPLSLGRGDVDRRIALEKTGSAELWQTPLWEGAAGLLVSPSRGLFVYSPFLLFSVAGFVRTWTDPRFKSLRPLTLAVGGHFLIASRWFDWWGGWCFGYRPIVDLMPLMAVLLAPSIGGIMRRKSALLSFAALLAWSIAVQFVGAFAYNLAGWNARVTTFEVTWPDQRVLSIPAEHTELKRVAREHPGALVREIRADIDQPRHRHRLWSLKDNQIFFHLFNFRQSRATRLKDAML